MTSPCQYVLSLKSDIIVPDLVSNTFIKQYLASLRDLPKKLAPIIAKEVGRTKEVLEGIADQRTHLVKAIIKDLEINRTENGVQISLDCSKVIGNILLSENWNLKPEVALTVDELRVLDLAEFLDEAIIGMPTNWQEAWKQYSATLIARID